MMRILPLPFFLLFAHVGIAQFKNLQIVPKSSEPTELSIAINHDDTKIIMAALSPDKVYFTVNGGMSWTKTTLTSPFGVLGSPSIVSDFKGNFYNLHLSNPITTNASESNSVNPEIFDRIVVQESKDGAAWSEGAFMGLNHPKDQIKPSATVDRKGNLFVAWTQLDNTIGTTDPTCQSNILFSTSSSGKKWSKPVVISQLPGDCKYDDNTAVGASPAVTPDGSRVFITWAIQGKIFLDRSFDAGETWLRNDIAIVNQHGGWLMNVPGFGNVSGVPMLVCDNTKKTQLTGALYMIWADQLNGENDTDIWFTRSMNFGDNWTPPLRVNDDAPGRHQFLPSLTLDPSTGFIYMIYYDRRNYDDTKTDVYLAYSTNAGATFTNVKISEESFVPEKPSLTGGHLSIAASNGIITPIWTRFDGSETSVWTAVIKHQDLEKTK